MTDLTSLSDQDLLDLYNRTDASRVMPALIQAESSGRVGVLGPPTKYGRAQGLTQMLPATAQAQAQKLGLPWRPDLMTGTSPEAADYQRQLGQGYLQEGIDKTGSVEDGLRYYHGGPDPQQWGPKTEAYVQKVSANLGGQPQTQPDLSGMSDADLLALYNQSAPSPSPPKTIPAPPRPAPVNPTSAPKKNQAKPSLLDDIGGYLANVERGTGIGDELNGAWRGVVNMATGKSPVDLGALATSVAGALPGGNVLNIGPAWNRSGVGDALKTGMAQQRQVEDDFNARRPLAAANARGLGIAGTMFVPGGAAAPVANASRLGNMARGALTAAATGAAYGLADRGSLQQRGQAATEAATNPVVLALGAGAGALTPVAPRVPRNGGPVNLDQLRAQRTAAYQAADAAGVVYSPQAVDDLVSNIEQSAINSNLNPARHPRAASMLQDIQDAGGNSMSLTQLDQLRQVVRRDVANAPDDAERFFGNQMIRQIDQFVDSAPPVVSGNANDAAQLIQNARNLNTRYRKVETIMDAVDSARLRAGSTGSGGNVDNAIRQNLRRVLENGNWTPEEEAALRSAVVGGPWQNALRLVGKLSPSGNGLMAALNLGSAAAGGLPGAIPGATGMIAKHVADNMTQQRVSNLLQIAGNPQLTPAQRQAAQTAAQQGLAQLFAANPAWARAPTRLAQGVGAAGGSYAGQGIGR